MDIDSQNFFIKEGYVPNYDPITNETIGGEAYWDAHRMLAAEIYQMPVYKFVSEYMKNGRNTLVDIGCGVGKKLMYVNEQNPSVNIIGVDQSDAIEYCKQNYKFGTWLIDDIEDSRLSEFVSADLVISSDVIEHLRNPNLLLDYVKRWLREDGIFIVSTPERDLLRGKNCMTCPNQYHVREWNFSEFETYLESQGFEVLKHFCQLPVKLKIGNIFFVEILSRLMRFQPLRYNQVVVARLK